MDRKCLLVFSPLGNQRLCTEFPLHFEWEVWSTSQFFFLLFLLWNMPLAWCPGTCLWLRWRMTSRSDGGRTSLARNCHVTFCLQSPFPGDKEEPPCNSTSCFVVIVFKFINLPLLVLKGCSLKYFSWLPAKVCWKLKLELEENLEAREGGGAPGASNTHFPFLHRLWRHFTVFLLSQQAGSPVLADRLKEQSPSAFNCYQMPRRRSYSFMWKQLSEIKVTED